MKKIALLVLVAALGFMASCNPSAKEIREKEIADSLKTDSIAKAQFKADSLKADSLRIDSIAKATKK